METKKCSKCGEVKPTDSFSHNKNERDGLCRYCRACSNAARAAYRKANLEKEKAREAAKYKANPEKWKAYSAARYKANQEKRKAYSVARIAALSDSYVARALYLKTADCTPELIELKRQQLTIHRLTKQLKQEIENV